MAAIKDPENTLIMEITHGRVVIELRPDLAPGHVARIKELAREGFYDGIVFHRVIDGFMAQTGCPRTILWAMTTVTITQAKRRLAELADRVSAGERITVTRDGEPVLEMVAPEPSRKGGYDPDAMKRFLETRGVSQFFSRVADDFDDPLPEDFLLRPLPE